MARGKTDEVDELWREFAAETQEHLEAMERLLSEHRAAGWSGEEIARLFRSFHSLKGACLVMGFDNLEALAHRAEDILSVVRDGKAELDGTLAALLLRTVDRLVDMRERAVADRRDTEPASDLMEELERHRAGRAAGPVEPVAETAPALAIGNDPEMLTIYSELLEQRLPVLARVLSDRAVERTEAAETAAELAYGAEMLGFERLAADLQAIERLAPDPDSRPALLAHLDELRQQAELIEEITGAASGAAGLAAALSGDLADDADAALDALAAALALPGGEVAGHAASVRGIFNVRGHDRAVGLLLLIEEQYGRDAAAMLPALAELAGIIVEALRLAADQDVEPDVAEAIAAQWQADRTAGPPGADTAPRPAGFPLPPELLATLSGEQRDRLDQAFAEGNLRAYEVLLELERDAEIAGDILEWLSSAVETITSRTVLRHGTSGFAFLILAPQPLDWVRAQLEALDPDQHCLLDVQEIGRVATAKTEIAVPVAAPLIRVRSEAIDGLMTEIGEMRSFLTGLREILRQGPLARVPSALQGFAETLEPVQAGALGRILDGAAEDLRRVVEIEEALERAHRRVWDAGLALRVVPVETLFGRVARSVRDLAQKLGKEVELVVDGRDVRIDKSMVDLLVDPLMHLVRNALDHGIEPPERRAALGKPARARLHLAAIERANGIHITIADDGRGLDTARILARAIERGLVGAAAAAALGDKEIQALIFRPGFSTAESVTDISGRGVGLDVVATALQRMGGTSEVETMPGAGTRFILKLPVSAALLRVLLVRVDGETLAVPERHIASVTEIEPAAMTGDAFQHDGATLPLHPLGRLLGIPAGATPAGELVRVVILSTATGPLGLIVDQFIRFQDLFLKELSPLLARLPAIAGASVLSDGLPVLVLDADGLAVLAMAAVAAKPAE